jgi:hypothetical protein
LNPHHERLVLIQIYAVLQDRTYMLQLNDR